MPRPHPSPPDSSGAAPLSKTRRKRDMEALQDLGERLVALDATRLATLDLPERLTDAVALARRLTRHEARRRQMQYIGRLMRDIDPAPLEAAFARWSEGPARERAQFAALERWRTRLMDEDAALDEFIAQHRAGAAGCRRARGAGARRAAASATRPVSRAQERTART
jgi:ribosome-associated protein